MALSLVLVLLASLAALPQASAADSGDREAVGTAPNPEWVLVLDSSERPTTPDVLRVTIDRGNETISVEISDARAEALSVLLKESEVRGIAPNPGFRNTSFHVVTYSGTTWFRVLVKDASRSWSFRVEEFRPELGEASYTFGSPASISVGRSMFVSLAEVPRVERDIVRRSNGNGTWTEEQAVLVPRMGINFTDADKSGQTVRLSLSWLGSFGVTEPSFRHADGKAIRNHTDATHAYLEPEHFSILYVFGNSNEGFTKEDTATYSELYWDSVNRNIYVKSDRRDPTGVDERLVSPYPVTYDQTSSFTVRATWKTSQQGNWQLAVPVFFMTSGNGKVDMANSVYVLYQSRDSWLGQSPYYYLRYRNSAGLQVNYQVTSATANVQYEFLLGYDAYTRIMTLAMYNNEGGHVGSTTYTLGTSETLALGKVGAAAWGASSTSEPTIIAKTDNILLDANAARNGNYELDGNGDGVPDNWQMWIWSDGNVYRSADRAKYGSYSVKITDSSTANDYGLQTVRLYVLPGQTYLGSAWVYVLSGNKNLCLEFWSLSVGGSRLGFVCKATTVTGQWEYLDVLLTAPTGAYWVDLVVYSSASNTGTGYFDGADLRRSRSFWAVQVHTNNVGTASQWATALDYVRDLGITTIRVDFPWHHFEPNNDDLFDPNVVVYWGTVTQMARRKGLGVIGILAHPPAWAESLYANNREAFWAEWREFAQYVSSQYLFDVYYYQILNEENHPLHGKIDHPDEPRAFQEAYQGLLAGEGLTAASHKSGFKTIVNMWADPLTYPNDWNTYFRDILQDPMGASSIDIVAIDHYPGTWCCGANYRDWGAIDTLFGIAASYQKEMAVMETGFTTYGFNPVPPFYPHYQTDQEAFVNEAIDEVFVKKNYYNPAYPLYPLVLVSWYDFIDVCSDCGGWPLVEYHFGIMTYNSGTGAWGLKLAFDNLRYQVSRWN